MKKLITSVAGVAFALCLANAHAAPECTFKSVGMNWLTASCTGGNNININVKTFIIDCAQLVPSVSSLRTKPFVIVSSNSCSSQSCTLQCSF